MVVHFGLYNQYINTSEPHVYAPSQGFNKTAKATIYSENSQTKSKVKHWPAGVGTCTSLQPDRQESLVRKTSPCAAHNIKTISTSSATAFFRTVHKFTIHRIFTEGHTYHIVPLHFFATHFLPHGRTFPLLCRQQECNRPTFRPLKVALGFNQACSGATTSIKDRQTRGPRLLTNEPCAHISQMVKVQIHTAVLPNEQVEGALQTNRKQRVTDYKLMQDNQREVRV